jgi:hypothetical protein
MLQKSFVIATLLGGSNQVLVENETIEKSLVGLEVANSTLTTSTFGEYTAPYELKYEGKLFKLDKATNLSDDAFKTFQEICNENGFRTESY